MSSTVNTCSFVCNNLFSFCCFHHARHAQNSNQRIGKEVVCSMFIIIAFPFNGNGMSSRQRLVVLAREHEKKGGKKVKEKHRWKNGWPSKMRKTVSEVNNRMNVLSTLI